MLPNNASTRTIFLDNNKVDDNGKMLHSIIIEAINCINTDTLQLVSATMNQFKRSKYDLEFLGSAIKGETLKLDCTYFVVNNEMICIQVHGMVKRKSKNLEIITGNFTYNKTA